jgi:hypothetical protein
MEHGAIFKEDDCRVAEASDEPHVQSLEIVQF